MALVSNWRLANVVESRALQVRYSVKRVRANGVIPVYYEVHRYAVKEYSYGGMTEAAAKACQAAKIAKYTRAIREWTYDPDQNHFNHTETLACPNDISAHPSEGRMWQCDISVNEDDVVLSIAAISSALDLLFSYIDCDYDE